MSTKEPATAGIPLVQAGLALAEGPTVLIGDTWHEGAGSAELTSLNPATGAVLATARAATADQAARAVEAARGALDGAWGALGHRDRADLLDSLADVMERHRAELEALVVTELGSPIASARTMQVGVSIDRIRFFADLARRGPTGGWERHLPMGDGVPVSTSVLVWRPAGVVTAITAYNFPLGIAALKVGAALAAGCAVVLSPSPRTFLTTSAFVRLVQEAGFPPGALNLVTGDADSSALLTTHPSVDVVTFTGSTEVGRRIQAQAAGTVKRVVLELGGKSPSVILPDAQLETAVRASVLRFTRNAGQACGATTRLVVPRDRVDEVAALAREVIGGLEVGDPWRESTAVGPLIREEQRASVEGAVGRAVKAGAELVAGGGRPSIGAGFFMNPALLGSVAEDDEICRQELFGPVAVLLPYDDLDDAVRLANATDFGLNAAVFGPTGKAIAVARRIRSGTVAINGGGPSRPDMPWGGFGQSGIGRDGGEEGFREFLEVQHLHWPL
ncbi:aldehyde dehydrogenase family protein [Streptosporangium amethystogenes]|uniref:aldehyde dehydrogenase family protein n=1 Tax=Streptosporangium amethystogenes TaxID=2002 RepID=UPI0006925DA8|nr:aldehyde dehydrogenase family protein [Streptosporangium amethystogenes]